MREHPGSLGAPPVRQPARPRPAGRRSPCDASDDAPISASIGSPRPPPQAAARREASRSPCRPASDPRPAEHPSCSRPQDRPHIPQGRAGVATRERDDQRQNPAGHSPVQASPHGPDGPSQAPIAASSLTSPAPMPPRTYRGRTVPTRRPNRRRRQQPGPTAHQKLYMSTTTATPRVRNSGRAGSRDRRGQPGRRWRLRQHGNGGRTNDRGLPLR